MPVKPLPAALILAVALVAAACSSPGASAATSTTLPVPTVPADCHPPAITTPTLPETIPGYTEYDPDAGLHVTGTAVEVDPATYRLEVTGLVDHPLSLSYDELRCLPRVESSPELVCPGAFVDDATWAGVLLRDVLGLAGMQAGATRIHLIAADGYSVWIDLDQDTLDNAFLAYEVNGETLPVLHGFPLRFVWPGHSGGYWVKWLVGIEVAADGDSSPA
jgi:DMSO/TMAO reductase YedYZ molybdopterin-dependent catalytic subunit